MHGEPVWARLHLTFRAWHDLQAPAARFLGCVTAFPPGETGILSAEFGLSRSVNHRRSRKVCKYMGINVERNYLG